MSTETVNPSDENQHISLDSPQGIADWAKALAVSVEEIVKAVKEVGGLVKDVKAYIETHKKDKK